MAIVLALAAALSWGTADFLAGLASRRVSSIVVLALVEVGGLVVILAIALLTNEPWFAEAGDAWLAVAAGVGGVVGLGCFYRALSIGTMSVVAPISAGGVAVPVLAGLATGDRPGVLQAVGLATIVGGIVLAARERDPEDGPPVNRTAIGLALVSAVGFGTFLACADAPSDDSVPWTLVLARAVALPFVAGALAVARPARPVLRTALALAAIGCIDLLANALIGYANREGDVSVVSVVASMYPVTTVVLAATLLHERLAAWQLLGVVLALGGVALVAAG